MGIKISQLPALGAPLPPDAELEIAYGAQSYKVTGAEIGGSVNVPSGNILVNPNPGDIMQRQDPTSLTSFVNDRYAADAWYILTQSASIQSQRTSGGNQLNAWRLKQNQAGAQRIGFAQIIENLNSFPLRDQTVTFALRVNISNNQALRFAILEWTGTANTVTSDVVNDWASSTYTAGNFFLGSNLTVTGVSSSTPSASTWTPITITATVGSSVNNLIVFVWTEGTAAQDVTLDIEECQLVVASSASAYSSPGFSYEVNRAKRFYQKSYNLDVPPATVTVTGSLTCEIIVNSDTAEKTFPVFFAVPMLNTPTITMYSANDGSSGAMDRNSVASPGAAVQVGNQIFTARSNSGSGNAGTQFRGHYTADASL